MGKQIRIFLWLLTGFLFAYDFYLWGGLAVTPNVGSRLRQEATFESPIAAAYLFLGRHVVVTVDRKDEAIAFAAGHFPDLIPLPDEGRQLIVTRFVSAQRALATLAYYLAPILLLLSLVLHTLRQKPIRSFGGRD